MSYWEILAALLSITYLLLAIKQNIWCWLAAFFSTLIYSILFFDATLIMSSILNAYYLLMAVYGWYSWKYSNKDFEDNLKVSSYSLMKNIKIILVLALVSFILGYFMKNYTNADFAYLDTTITVFALFSTYMMTKKVLQNWLYWIVIDSASIYLYAQKGFYLTAVLFLTYTILAIFAYFQWKKEFKTIELR